MKNECTCNSKECTGQCITRDINSSYEQGGAR